MRKFWSVLLYILSAFVILMAVVAFLSILTGRRDHTTHGSDDTAFLLGYITGAFLFPGLLIWLAIALFKKANRLNKHIPVEDVITETPDTQID